LRFALEMADAGIELMRCNLRRQHPEADEARIQELVNDWLIESHADEWDDPHFTPRAAPPTPPA
jgi:hypothetical protein